MSEKSTNTPESLDPQNKEAEKKNKTNLGEIRESIRKDAEDIATLGGTTTFVEEEPLALKEEE